MENVIPSGVVKDTRPRKEKRKDHTHIAGSVSINWWEKPPSSWKRYKQRIQNGSLSCCFQSMAKAIEIVSGKQMSALEYFWRKNYPNGGAYLQDVGDIAKNKHFALESAYPSQNLSEATMNTIKPLVTVLGITGYAQPAIKNIDEIAEGIEAYGHCLLTFVSNNSEWDSSNKTPVYKGTATTFGHCITSVDYALVNGKKCLIVEDSAGQWSSSDGLRIITEDFLKHRNTGALYITGVVDYSIPEAPVHHVVVTENATINTDGTPSFWKKYFGWLNLWNVPFTVE